MRQIGIICAAALVALKENVGKLESDHKKTRLLADGLNEIKGLRVNPCSIETNIIFIDIVDGSRTTTEKIFKYLEERGILLMQEKASRLRVVLHHQISASDVQYTLSCFQQAVQIENGN
uniref:Aromatic amino acid beta-eliminating lyase/threonine aldolase domain-containing protein n=1 Tax=Medicago truncatula TaxID=3880 RepID=B7FG96_MEDTR|nr:unknown [Medicago truncatula]